MSAPQLSYTGIDVLETLEGATNYNSLLLDLILENSQGRSRMLDFGAGTGTFAKLVRTKGIEVVCVEPDTHLAERLIRDGFLTFNDLNDVPDGSFEFILTLNVFEHVGDDWTSFSPARLKTCKGRPASGLRSGFSNFVDESGRKGQTLSPLSSSELGAIGPFGWAYCL
jgi:SAM-dependent methyltransferase